MNQISFFCLVYIDRDLNNLFVLDEMGLLSNIFRLKVSNYSVLLWCEIKNGSMENRVGSSMNQADR